MTLLQGKEEICWKEIRKETNKPRDTQMHLSANDDLPIEIPAEKCPGGTG
jgi:hypothetical protein